MLTNYESKLLLLRDVGNPDAAPNWRPTLPSHGLPPQLKRHDPHKVTAVRVLRPFLLGGGRVAEEGDVLDLPSADVAAAVDAGQVEILS